MQMIAQKVTKSEKQRVAAQKETAAAEAVRVAKEKKMQAWKKQEDSEDAKAVAAFEAEQLKKEQLLAAYHKKLNAE